MIEQSDVTDLIGLMLGTFAMGYVSAYLIQIFKRLLSML